GFLKVSRNHPFGHRSAHDVGSLLVVENVEFGHGDRNDGPRAELIQNRGSDVAVVAVSINHQSLCANLSADQRADGDITSAAGGNVIGQNGARDVVVIAAAGDVIWHQLQRN